MTEPTITEFLCARIAEDAEMARAATSGPWRYNPDKAHRGDYEESVFAGPAGKEATTVASTGPMDDGQSMADAAHIARHDPARVLAECEAKRRILELHPTYKAAPYKIEGGEMYYPPDPYYCDCQCPDGIIYGHDPCETKRVLAAPYADHPDYREEWKP